MFLFPGCPSDIYEPPTQEWTDSAYQVIYERVKPYVSNEETNSLQRVEIHRAEEPTWADKVTGWFTLWNGADAELAQTSEIRFEGIISDPMPKEVALFAEVSDKGKAEAGGTWHNGEKIYINGVELVKIGEHPWGNSGSVAYFLIGKDGSILP